MYNRIYKFFSDNNLIQSILYNLVLDKNIQQFLPSLTLLKVLGKI